MYLQIGSDYIFIALLRPLRGCQHSDAMLYVILNTVLFLD
jgi:hypothetical protein